MRLGFLKRRRRIQQPKDIRSALSQLAKFLEECDRDTEKLRRDTAGQGRFQITVIRRELNIGKLLRPGIFLVCIIVFLAVGFAAGWYWSPMAQAKLRAETAEGAETAVAPTVSVPVVSPTAGKDSARRPSSQDTLLQKVRELRERVERGE